MKRILVVLILVPLFTTTYSQTTAWDNANEMRKGANLSNWLEASWLGGAYPDETYYTKEHIKLISDLGMKNVRLPVIFEWLSDTTAPYSLDLGHTTYELIDSVILWTDEYDLKLILVNHHPRELTDANYSSQINRVKGMWRNLALHYGTLSHEHILFEIRNEPDNNISNANFRIVAQAIIDEIRMVNTTHTLLVGANWWNAGWSLITTAPYSDNNIIYTFHNYSPYNFTHQGFSWSGLPSGVPFPNSATDIQDLRQNLMDVKNWSDSLNVPIYLGEFGVSTYADDVSRCTWIETIGEITDSLVIPWAYWDMFHYNESFGFLKSEALHVDSMISCFASALSLPDTTSAVVTPPPTPTLPPTDTVTSSISAINNHSLELVNTIVDDYLIIKSTSEQNIDIAIYNSSGHLCEERIVKENLNYIELNNLSTGLYVLKSKGGIALKFIKR